MSSTSGAPLWASALTAACYAALMYSDIIAFFGQFPPLYVIAACFAAVLSCTLCRCAQEATRDEIPLFPPEGLLGALTKTATTSKKQSPSASTFVSTFLRTAEDFLKLLPTYLLVVFATSSPEKDTLLVFVIYVSTAFGLLAQEFPRKMGIQNLASFSCPAFTVLPANVMNFLGRSHGATSRSNRAIFPEELSAILRGTADDPLKLAPNLKLECVFRSRERWSRAASLPPGGEPPLREKELATQAGFENPLDALGRDSSSFGAKSDLEAEIASAGVELEAYRQKLAAFQEGKTKSFGQGDEDEKKGTKGNKDEDVSSTTSEYEMVDSNGKDETNGSVEDDVLPEDIAFLLSDLPSCVSVRGPKVFGFTLYNMCYPFLLIDRREPGWIIAVLVVFNFLDRLWMLSSMTLLEQRSFRRQRWTHDVTVILCWIYTLVKCVLLGYGEGGVRPAFFLIWRNFYLGHLLLFVAEHVIPTTAFGLRSVTISCRQFVMDDTASKEDVAAAKTNLSTAKGGANANSTSTSPLPAFLLTQSAFGPRERFPKPDGLKERVKEVYMRPDWRELLQKRHDTHDSIAFHGTGASSCAAILETGFEPKLGQIGTVTYFASDVDAASCFSGDGWVFVVALDRRRYVAGVTTANFTPHSEGRECPTYVVYEYDNVAVSGCGCGFPTSSSANSAVLILGIIRIRLYDGPWAPSMRNRGVLSDEFRKFMDVKQDGHTAASDSPSESSTPASPSNKNKSPEIYYNTPSDLANARKHVQFRFVQWNIQYWHTLGGRLDIDAMFAVFTDLDADILVLNEVMFLWPYLVQKDFEKRLREKCGFNHFLYGNTTKWDPLMRLRKAFFGNVICSKTELENPMVIEMPGSEDRPHEDRSAVAGTLEIGVEDGEGRSTSSPKQKIRLVGTHLEIWDQSGQAALRQTRQILGKCFEDGSDKNTSSSASSSNSTLEILCGDLNSFRRCEYSENRLDRFPKPHNFNVIRYLERDGFEDAFSLCGVDPPEMSVWSTARVDYFFVRERRQQGGQKDNEKSKNAFKDSWRGRVYKNCVSDHAPLILERQG
ncbi:unnamed protein product [Amoebophrya sp. A25]|nr:unnamed protein product [Amoebophrya sp. A25]|eukprot:GSA25T00023205001.1